MATTPHSEHEVYCSNCIACIMEARREMERLIEQEQAGLGKSGRQPIRGEPQKRRLR